MMSHVDEADDDFGHRLALAQLDYVTTSTAKATALAENYTGLPDAPAWSHSAWTDQALRCALSPLGREVMPAIGAGAFRRPAGRFNLRSKPAVVVKELAVEWRPRRVVTGHDENGTSVVLSAAAPVTETFIRHDGAAFFEVWSTASAPAPVSAIEPDPTLGPVIIPPPRAGTRIRINQFEPGHVRDGRQSPWHRTETVDYGIMIEGELVLLLDDSEVVLRPGDIVVQRGTNHAWANRSGAVARIAFVLVDGVFDETLTAVLGPETLEDAAAARSHEVTASHNFS